MKIVARLNKHGESLVSVLIAAFLLAVVALTVADLVVTSKMVSNNTQSFLSCDERANYVINLFKKNDNKISVNNWTASAVQARPNPGQFFHSERYLASYNMPPIQPSTALSLTTPWNDTNAFELIDNGSNWALSLYNRDPGFCTTGGKLIESNGAYQLSYSPSFGPLVPPGQNLNLEKLYLQIQRYYFDGTTPDCQSQGTFRLPALGTLNTNAATIDPTNGSKSGLVVTSTINYTDNRGVVQRCTASTTVKPDGDMTPPVFVTPPAADMPPSPKCVGPPGKQLCGGVSQVLNTTPPTFCSSGEAILSFAVSEPAVVFACHVDYLPPTTDLTVTPLPTTSAGATFYPCANFNQTIAGQTVTGQVTSIDMSKPSDTVVTLKLTNVPDGYYEVWIEAFDSGQNISAPSNYSFELLTSGPTSIDLIPPPNLVGGYGGTFAGSTAIPAPYSSLYSTTTFPGLYQCSQNTWGSTSGYTWTVLYTYPWGQTAGTANFTMDTNAVSPCQSAFTVPNGLSQGNHALTAVACNVCGTSPPNDYQQWLVDTAAPVAAHVANATNGYFIQPTLPSWALSDAKPANSNPFGYACENNLASPQFSFATTACAPQGMSSSVCTAQGSGGFCTRVYDACGRMAKDAPTLYQILGKLGDPCGQVQCQAGLICALDAASGVQGKCVSPKACTVDSDCGTGICITNTNTCDGSSVGPATGINNNVPCPTLTTACGTNAVAPTCSCNATTAAATCDHTTFADSCGNVGACLGTMACPLPSPSPAPSASPPSCLAAGTLCAKTVAYNPDPATCAPYEVASTCSSCCGGTSVTTGTGGYFCGMLTETYCTAPVASPSPSPGVSPSPSPSPSPTPGKPNFCAGLNFVSAGYRHTCAVFSGKLYCFGDNSGGNINTALGSTVPTPYLVTVSGVSSWGDAVAGENETCATSSGGQVYCWGYMNHGQNGVGVMSGTSAPTAVVGGSGASTCHGTLSAGEDYKCGSFGGLIKCYGVGNDYQFGVNPTTYTPTATCFAWGGASLNCDVPTSFAPFPAGAQTALGEAHSCFINEGTIGSGGQVTCFGRNESGQLGIGTTSARQTNSTPVSLPANAIKISAHTSTTCAMLSNNTVYCWGFFNWPGWGTVNKNPVDATTNFLGGKLVSDIAVGGLYMNNYSTGSYYPVDSFVCAIVNGASAGEVWCWGNNTYGQLGNGSNTSTATAVQVVTSSGPLTGATWISAGNHHACAVANNHVYCWGDNKYGQLGDGTLTSSAIAKQASGL